MSMSFLHVRRKLASLQGFIRPALIAAVVPMLALVCLCFLVGMATAKPPQAPNPPQAPTFIPPCGCGCMEMGQCKCKNCCERTADPNWKPSHSAPQVTATAGQLVQVCGPNGCRLVKVSPTGDFIYDPQTPGQPSTGGCQDGSCGSAGGSCGTSSGWYLGKNLGRPTPRRLR
jgi:hypothetical protein